MDVAAVRPLVLALRCQLFLCHLFTRCDGASACNPARTPPVEPTRPQTTYIITSAIFNPCPAAFALGRAPRHAKHEIAARVSTKQNAPARAFWPSPGHLLGGEEWE